MEWKSIEACKVRRKITNVAKEKRKLGFENGLCSHLSMVFENIKDKTIENRMKCGCYETINNAAHCYQTSFNIAVILGNLSDCDNMHKSTQGKTCKVLRVR